MADDVSEQFRTYSLTEVAERLRITDMSDPERWLTSMIKRGTIPARKIGRSWRMTEADIHDMMEAIKNKPQEPTALDRHPSGLSKRSRQLRGMD